MFVIKKALIEHKNKEGLALPRTQRLATQCVVVKPRYVVPLVANSN